MIEACLIITRQFSIWVVLEMTLTHTTSFHILFTTSDNDTLEL